ncbi:MAG: Mini-ribonuclease 3 [Tindallia sp. MSAO_Bac2]|nr:MAG: Mini-ribonuclease 3 [Tindallia sp. MSAO_Bac2]
MKAIGIIRESNAVDKHVDTKMISPLTMAYMGDAIFELFVRDQLVTRSEIPVNKLHLKAIEYVKAASQAKIAHVLKNQLTEEEQWMVRRGRNQKSTAPKNAELSEYRYATGFEALIGYLYYQNKTERMLHIMTKGMEILDERHGGEKADESQ